MTGLSNLTVCLRSVRTKEENDTGGRTGVAFSSGAFFLLLFVCFLFCCLFFCLFVCFVVFFFVLFSLFSLIY